jgi:hypothetical protein
LTRALSGGFAAALAEAHVDAFPLIELQFASGTDYLCGLDHAVTWNGNTYIGTAGVMSIQSMQETAGTAQGLQIQISAAPTANLALALNERVQGRPIILRLAVIDASGAVQVDPNVWAGLMDTMPIDDSGSNPVISITAEHMLAVWDRSRPVRYTDAQQQALYPGDRCCEFVAALADAQIVWPGKAFFAV